MVQTCSVYKYRIEEIINVVEKGVFPAFKLHMVIRVGLDLSCTMVTTQRNDIQQPTYPSTAVLVHLRGIFTEVNYYQNMKVLFCL